MNAVEIRFLGNKQYVEARTTWTSGMGLVKKSLKDIKRGISGSQKLQVNYTVFLPNTCDINVDNQFGDVYMSDLKGTLQADITHGNFRAHTVKKIKRLKLKYGDIRIDELIEGNIIMSYGDLELNKVEELNLDCSTTDVMIEEVNAFNLISKNDNVQIGSVHIMNGSTALTSLKINYLFEKADINSRFGSVKVYKIDPGFGRINMNGSYTAYTIITSKGINSGFKVTLENGKTFSYDNDISISNHTSTNKIDTYVGKVGSGGEENIRIYSKNGNVSFQF